MKTVTGKYEIKFTVSDKQTLANAEHLNDELFMGKELQEWLEDALESYLHRHDILINEGRALSCEYFKVEG